jgi:ribulose bisphosphate carboxylase small subunit
VSRAGAVYQLHRLCDQLWALGREFVRRRQDCRPRWGSWRPGQRLSSCPTESPGSNRLPCLCNSQQKYLRFGAGRRGREVGKPNTAVVNRVLEVVTITGTSVSLLRDVVVNRTPQHERLSKRAR